VLTGLAAEHLRGTEVTRTFSVDFAGSGGDFQPDEVRATPDGPYVRDVAEHAGSEHQNIVIDAKELADPALRTDAVLARDMAVATGDLDKSLLLLFRAVRRHSTVALSGEAADEVFGGYLWFHTPAMRDVDNFPWEEVSRKHGGHELAGLLDPGLLDLLDVPGYTESRYREALAEVPYGRETDSLERRMREVCYLHLTRLLTIMLERKDRMSMATGLEVRVPFCDHRLVTYVFNAPWSAKTFDGREKSLLRHAAADILPRSVVERVKSPYPSTRELAYTTALQAQVKDLLSSGSSAVDLLDRTTLARWASMDPVRMAAWQRHQMDKALDLAVWLEHQRPALKLV
jgi:asparagine synthase (glutamine-hydrolysing)